MDKAERDMRRMQGIIHAMTPAEREKPELIPPSFFIWLSWARKSFRSKREPFSA